MSTFISGKYCPLFCLCKWYSLRPINLCRSPYLLITLIGLAMITSDCYVDALDGVQLLPSRDFPALKKYGLSLGISNMHVKVASEHFFVSQWLEAPTKHPTWPCYIHLSSLHKAITHSNHKDQRSG